MATGSWGSDPHSSSGDATGTYRRPAIQHFDEVREVNDVDLQEVLALLARAPKPPEAPLPTGANPGQIASLERNLGHPIPAGLRRWLSVCNGYMAGPGGLYGAEVDRASLDINQASWPEWRALGWIPIAGDGNGNAYVVPALPQKDDEPVYFVDCAGDPSSLAYIVASSIPQFLTFLLRRDMGEPGWPFDRDYVLDRDPLIADVDADRLPWAG